MNDSGDKFAKFIQRWRDVIQALLARRKTPEFVAVVVHRTLDSVAPVWRALDQDGHSTVFQKSDWFISWATHFAAAQGAEWIVIELRDMDGHPAMLLPFERRTTPEGLKRLALADLGAADYTGPIVAAGFAPDRLYMRRIWDEVLRQLPRADVIHLQKMPERIGGAFNPLLLLEDVRQMGLTAWCTPLAATFPQWVQETLDPKFAAKMFERQRKLGKRGKLTFSVAATADERRVAFDTLRRQRARRCGELNWNDILQLPGAAEFYEQLLNDEHGAPLTVIAVLSLDEEIIATGYGLVANETFHMIFPTLEPDRWRNYSPGIQMFLKTIEWSIERGLRHFDFTIGAEGFKKDFGAQPKKLFEKSSALGVRGLPSVIDHRMRRKLRQYGLTKAMLRRVFISGVQS